MKVSRETFRTVRWLLVGLLVVQVLIVSWRPQPQPSAGLVDPFGSAQMVSGYAPIFAPPSSSAPLAPRMIIDASRLLVQLAVTGGLLLLWLRVAKPED